MLTHKQFRQYVKEHRSPNFWSSISICIALFCFRASRYSPSVTKLNYNKVYIELTFADLQLWDKI